MTRFERLRRSIRAELEPYPGRMSGTMIDTLSMVLALLIAETLRVPGIALALALILLLQRESPGTTFRNVLQIFAGAAAACAASLFWIQLTDGTEIFRFIGFVLCVFAAGFCMAGTRYPLFFTIFGFYGFVDLAGWDTHRSPTAIVTATLFNMASLAIALGTAGVVNFLFGSRHPAEELQTEMNRRLQLLAVFHRQLSTPVRTSDISRLHQRVVQYAHAGDIRLNQLYEELRSSSPDRLPPGMRFRIGLLTRVLERSSVLGFVSSTECSGHLRIAELCKHILNPQRPRPAQPDGHTSTQLREIFAELSRYEEAADEARSGEESPAVKPTSWKVFHSDAFTSPDAVLYSLKLTLSAVICYILYNAIAWPGILTCVVTVLFTGLSSTGAMKQKQLYRLAGAAIGGALAILIESLLFPNMDSVTSLVLVSAAVCMASAWISRSPGIGYVGVQIAFAFFLTDLPGFGPASQIAPARDRVIGIALGVLVMWFVFDQIWPTRPSDALESIRSRVQNNLKRLTTQSPSMETLGAMRAEVSSDLAQMQSLISSAWFDFSADQHRELARSRRITRQTEAAAAEFYSHLHQVRRHASHSG